MRRPLLCIGCVAIVAAAVFLSTRYSLGEPAAASTPTVRSFHFTYWTKIPAPAEGSKRMEVWVPLPIEDDLQKVSDLQVECPVATTTETETAYGNKMLHVVVENPKDVLPIAWTATIVRTADFGQGKGPNNPLYLKADRMIPVDGLAAKLAGDLKVTGSDKPVAERAKTIYEHVLQTMTYDKVAEGWGKGDFKRACEVGKGNCTDFHAKFMGIARAAGIPARFTMGISVPTDPKGSGSGYHCWAHFLDADHWVPVDISEAQKVLAKDAAKAAWFYSHLDADRISLSVGRDVNLAPKQQGGPLYHFVFPYVEVDGKSVEVPKEARGFTYENVAK